jgi:VCBS repeat-containing protein
LNYAGKFGSSGPDPFSNARVDLDSLSHRGYADSFTVPDARLLFSGDYHKSGHDLIISDHNHRVVVPNYFRGDKRPALVSPDGAPLDPKVVDALTGHTEYAQAGGPPAATVVGHVVKMTGSASIVRNGVTIDVQNGDAVYRSDVVQTGSGSTLGLVLNDGTTFNLSANARLMLNDLTYDANSTSNSSLVTLVQGAASFVAGQVAKTGDMKVATPVAVMGIRGTAVILDISSTDGKVSISVVDQRDGQIHAVQVFNTRGDLIGTVTSSGTGLTLTPTATFEVIAQESNKTVAQVAQEFDAFQAVLNTYDVGKQLYPNLPQHTDNSDGKGDNSNPQTTRFASGSTPASSPGTEFHAPAGTGSVGPGSTGGVAPVVVTTSSSPPVVGPTGSLSPPSDSIPILIANVPVTPIPFVVTPPTVSRISSDSGDHFGPVMSADGQFVTYDPDGAIFLFDRQTGTTSTIQSPGGGFTYSAPTISSDGRFIVYQRSDGVVFLYNNDASDALHYHQTTLVGPGTSPAISGDGSRIVVEHGGTSLGVYDQEGHELATITPAGVGSSGAVWKPAISADGHVIAFWNADSATAGGSGHLFTYNLSTGIVAEIASTVSGAGTSAASISADGHYVVYQSDSSGHSEIYLYDLTTGHVVFNTANATGGSYNPVISPDGHFIIFASDARLTSDDTNSVADTYVVDVTDPGHPVYKLVSVGADGAPGDAASNLGAAISAGGQFIAFGSSASNFATGDNNGTGDIFVVDPNSGRTAIIQEDAHSPSILTASGVIAITGAVSGVTLGVSDPSRFSAEFSADGKSIQWSFHEAKSDFASLPYGQDSSQPFVITLSTASSGTVTIPVTVIVHNAVQPVFVPVDAPPVAVPVTLAQGQENNAYIITAAALLTGVSDIDGPSLSIADVTIKSGGGSISHTQTGDWIYTPPANYFGPVVFNYTASDGTKTASSTANLNIVAPDHAPTDILLSNSSIPENYPPGTVIGALSAIDPDFGDTATFTLIDGGGGDFRVGGGNLVLGNLALDYERQPSYQITIRATDSGGLSFDKTITINITDVPGVVLIGDNSDNILTGTIEADTLSGLGGNDVLTGFGGNDLLDGGAGRDKADYSGASAGITVNLAAGVVQGTAASDLAFIGTDTLRSIEYIRGSNFADTFDATGFSNTSANAGSVPTAGRFSGSITNYFEGGGGDDTVIGNGATMVVYDHATDAVIVDLAAGTAQGTAPGDAANVGHDTFSGVTGARGSAYNDALLGNNDPKGVDVFYGGAGNDFIDGRAGYDLVIYSPLIDNTVTGGITVNMAIGTVVGDASVGTDTLRSIESIRGTTFNDTYNAVGFGGSSTNAGSFGTFNQFEGMDGDDTIIGNGFTTVEYTNAVAGVTVDIAAGNAHSTAAGDVAGVGADTFTGVNGIRGSEYDDILSGSNNPAGTTESFTGGGGNDIINGRGGFDRAIYSSTIGDRGTGGITVNMAAGTVFGDDSVGSDTLLSIEAIRGTNFNDTYDATGFGGTSTNAGSFGTFNEFEGMGGDDTVIGNGNTRVAFYSASAGVTVDLATGTSFSTTPNDAANVGVDTISGVDAVTGSAFADNITGDSAANILNGGGGDDTIDGGGGTDLAVFSGPKAAYTISFDTPSAGQIQVADSVADGTDTLSNIEALEFGDGTVLVASGTAASPIDLAAFTPGISLKPVTTLTGSADDFVLVNSAMNGLSIDLGAGTGDTVALASAGFYSLNLANVESVIGSGGNDNVNLINNANGLAVDLGAGDDTLNLGASSSGVTFVYADNDGADVVSGFNGISGDKIDLTGVSGVHSLADVQAIASQSGANTVIDFGNGNSLTLTGILPADLVDGDFVFTANHPATIDGDTTGSLVEDEQISINSGDLVPNDTCGGTLTVHDVDSGENYFQPVKPDALAGRYGNFTFDENTGDWTYQVDSSKVQYLGDGATATDTLTVISVDGTAHQDIVVTITGTNDAPVATPVTLAAGTEDTTYIIDASALLAGVTDVDGPFPLSITTVTVASGGGSVFDNLDGTFTYTPATNYSGLVSFNYTASDGTLTASSTASLTLAPPGVITGTPGPDVLLGTSQADAIYGLDGNDIIKGFQGNDLIDGGAGRDISDYSDATGPISVDMASGTVTGDASVGTDTMRSIESVRGTDFNDTYVATGFNQSSPNNAQDIQIISSISNTFEGGGGNDTITGSSGAQASYSTGNGGTQISYAHALDGVTVDLRAGTAHGTAAGDIANVGTDTFTQVSGVVGSNYDDTLLGTDSIAHVDVFYGGAGNDFIDGRNGYDFVSYYPFFNPNSVTSGISVDLAAGTVIGDPSVGTDTLRSIELVRGTQFNDTYTAVGFGSNSTNAGSGGTFNQFEGMGGDDTIIGNGNTRVDYNFALAAVTVDLAAGTGHSTNADDADVGNDIIVSGVNSVRGSSFNDSLFGSANNENFLGGYGDDLIDGRGGFDRAVYNVTADDAVTGGISVDLAAGTVHGDISVGNDTLRSIEAVQGTDFADTYVATNFGAAGFLNAATNNVGNFGTFNEVEGGGGNDTVTGNGNTRIAFYNALDGVTVDLSAHISHGTAPGDVAGVGTDTFSGVNAVAGSSFDDTITGSDNPGNTTEEFAGRAGNDFIDGKGGFDRAFYNNDGSASGIQIDMASGAVVGDAAIGTDTLRSIESIRGTNFADTYVATNFGSGANIGNFGTFNEFEGMGGNDTITGNGNTRIAFYNALDGVTVDLAAGTSHGTASGDVAFVGTDTFTGVNWVRGSNFADTIYGDANANTLEGRDGNDVIEGRGGNDSLTGGAGGDQFIFRFNSGNDTVTDFAPDIDRLDIHDYATFTQGDSGSFAAWIASAAVEQQAGGTLIHLDANNSVLLSNVAKTSLAMNDFILHPAGS